MGKILVADDNEYIGDILTKMLSYDHEVTVVRDGNETIDLLTEDSSIGLLILDIGMPICNGWEALSVIKDPDNWPDLPIIMFTVRTEPENALKAWIGGVDYYITKPFSKAELLQTVQRALNEKNQNAHS